MKMNYTRKCLNFKSLILSAICTLAVVYAEAQQVSDTLAVDSVANVEVKMVDIAPAELDTIQMQVSVAEPIKADSTTANVELEKPQPTVQIPAQPTAALPVMLQKKSEATHKPVVTSIGAEIPNDTIKPMVKIKVITTEEMVAARKPAPEATQANEKSDGKTKTEGKAKTATTATKKTSLASDKKVATTDGKSGKKVVAADGKTDKSAKSKADKASGEKVYHVQICAMQSPNKQNEFKKILGTKFQLLVKSENGLHKYMVGSFKTYDDAAKCRTTMVQKGFKDAFIVAYQKGKRVDL